MPLCPLIMGYQIPSSDQCSALLLWVTRFPHRINASLPSYYGVPDSLIGSMSLPSYDGLPDSLIGSMPLCPLIMGYQIPSSDQCLSALLLWVTRFPHRINASALLLWVTRFPHRINASLPSYYGVPDSLIGSMPLPSYYGLPDSLIGSMSLPSYDGLPDSLIGSMPLCPLIMGYQIPSSDQCLSALLLWVTRFPHRFNASALL